MITLADILDFGAGKVAPGPRGHPLLGSLPAARRDPLKLFMESFRDYGEVVRFRFGPMVAHLVSSPSGVNQILAERRKRPGDDLLSMLMEATDESTGEKCSSRAIRRRCANCAPNCPRSWATAIRRWRICPSCVSPGWSSRSRCGSIPPAWTIARSVSQADEIGGYQIPAGSIVFVSPYVVHRNPRVWQDPEGFDPHRFAGENIRWCPTPASRCARATA